MSDRNERIAAAFERLFRTYERPAQGTAEELRRIAVERTERAKVYFEAVDVYEAGDIETAVANFLSGAAPGHNPNYPPPAPLVGSETRRVMNLRLDRSIRERAAHPKLPPPDVVRTPESMARVAAKMAETVENLAASKRTDDAAADKRRGEMFAKTNEMFAPDMSLEAQRQRLVPRAWGYDVGDEEVA